MFVTGWRSIAACTVSLAIGAAVLAAGEEQATASTVVAYENGYWFMGSTFEPRRMYVQGNTFIEPGERPDLVIDLDGGYVVPPFGEAHDHNVELIPSQPARLEATLNAYLQAGVFYVQNPNSFPGTRESLSERLDRIDSPDVTFAHGGITGPGGHPVGVVERNIARGAWTSAQGEGAFLFSVEDAVSLDAAWSALLASRPDFVKVYLLYSEEYSTRLTDPETIGWRGLDPTVVPEVVRRADEAGLRVLAHVESAADSHVAVEAGVDQIAHMPGFRRDPDSALPDPARYRVSEADALMAARKGVVVVTTLAGLAEYAAQEGDSTLRTAADRLNRANLSVLLRNGVGIAIGSDDYDGTSVAEAQYLATLGVFDPAALLRSWSETTPRAIFPERRIGRLAPGYEASFLVLDDDPLEDFANVTRIRSAVKQGQAIALR